MPIVRDLFLGRPSKYSSSFALEQTILAEFNLLFEFSSIDSNPLSWNDTSVPSTLVPVIVLIVAVAEVSDPGVNTSKFGVISVNWIFFVTLQEFPAREDSLANDNSGAPEREPSEDLSTPLEDLSIST